MADQFGGLFIPTVTPSEDDGDPLAPSAPGDELLATILGFLKAVLVDEGTATNLWNAIGGGDPVIVGRFPWDPREVDHLFSDKQLPALFLWRESATQERIADEYRIEKSILTLLWVMKPAPRDKQIQRVNAGDAMAKLITAAFERGRSPSFQVAPELVADDYQAPVKGAYWALPAKIWSLFVTSHRMVPIRIEMLPVANGKQVPPRVYRGLEMKLELKERLHFDTTVRSDPFTGGTDVTAQINGGTQFDEVVSKPA